MKNGGTNLVLKKLLTVSQNCQS